MRHRAVLFLALIMIFVFLGIGCNQTKQSVPARSKLLPEDTFALYREGWKKRDVSLILEACVPTAEAQERCRKLFEAIDGNGGSGFMADKLERATFKLSRDDGAIRYYEMAADGESQPLVFQLTEEGDWKIAF